ERNQLGELLAVAHEELHFPGHVDGLLVLLDAKGPIAHQIGILLRDFDLLDPRYVVENPLLDPGQLVAGLLLLARLGHLLLEDGGQRRDAALDSDDARGDAAAALLIALPRLARPKPQRDHSAERGRGQPAPR